MLACLLADTRTLWNVFQARRQVTPTDTDLASTLNHTCASVSTIPPCPSWRIIRHGVLVSCTHSSSYHSFIPLQAHQIIFWVLFRIRGLSEFTACLLVIVALMRIYKRRACTVESSIFSPLPLRNSLRTKARGERAVSILFVRPRF